MSPGTHSSSRAATPRRFNRLRHGLRAAAIVIPGVESQKEWERFEAHIMRSLDPENAIEVALAARVAETLWRMQRVTLAEGDDIDAVRAGGDADWYQRQVLPDSGDLDKLIRYEAHLSRQLYQALHQLEALKQLRLGNPAPLARVTVHGLPEP